MKIEWILVGSALLLAVPSGADEGLKKALVFHATFDEKIDADFSTADPRALAKTPAGLVPLPPHPEEAVIERAGGRFGGALHFPKKGTTRPSYTGQGMLGYHEKNWNATVSLWLRLTPDEDLEPGYCDPIQVVGDDTKNGFIFLEWSKDHQPRYFRYAIRPRIELWDPEGLGWEKVPEPNRPMVQLKQTPFSRDRWTHAVFTLEKINAGKGRSAGALYLDGHLRGRIENFDLSFGWDPASVLLVLGAAYVGRLDDVAVFNRVLDEREVAVLHGLAGGVSDLRP